MHKIIQITDPHLSRLGQVFWGLDPYYRLKAAFKGILTFHSDAKACFISGDLTNSASSEALLRLKDALAAFPISTYLVIGNHDVRSVFFDLFETYPRDENGFLRYSFELVDTQFICLDTKKDEPVLTWECCPRLTIVWNFPPRFRIVAIHGISI